MLPGYPSIRNPQLEAMHVAKTLHILWVHSYQISTLRRYLQTQGLGMINLCPMPRMAAE